jgi:hypothetical protein
VAFESGRTCAIQDLLQTGCIEPLESIIDAVSFADDIVNPEVARVGELGTRTIGLNSTTRLHADLFAKKCYGGSRERLVATVDMLIRDS